MKNVAMFAGCAILIAILAIGCSSSTPGTADSKTSDAKSPHGDHDHEKAGSDAMATMKAELAKLSPEDAASAEKQHMCPVSGELLGTMGPPIKLDVNGTQVWICCDHCKETIQKDPEKYLAKLESP